MKMTITQTEVKWIIGALNHDMADVRQEMETSSDDSPIAAFGELFLEGRERLVNKFIDLLAVDGKVISVTK